MACEPPTHVAEMIEQLAETYAQELPLPDAEHARRCASFAAHLFDVLADRLELRPSDRLLTIAAALWHDVGYARAARDHMRKSFDMLVGCNFAEFDAEERVIIACAARYHRRLLPNIEHAGFGTLSSSNQRRVRRISAIVRLAVALDAGHLGAVTKIEVDPAVTPVVVRVFATGSAEVERDRLSENAAAFERLTYIPLRVEVERYRMTSSQP